MGLGILTRPQTVRLWGIGDGTGPNDNIRRPWGLYDFLVNQTPYVTVNVDVYGRCAVNKTYICSFVRFYMSMLVQCVAQACGPVSTHGSHVVGKDQVEKYSYQKFSLILSSLTNDELNMCAPGIFITKPLHTALIGLTGPARVLYDTKNTEESCWG